MMEFQGFKPEAMNRIAKALGHDGDMGGFQDFLEKNPEKKDMMEGFNKKAVQMMQGGYVKGYAPGGFIDPTIDKFGPGMVDPRIPNFNDGQTRLPNQFADALGNLIGQNNSNSSGQKTLTFAPPPTGTSVIPKLQHLL